MHRTQFDHVRLNLLSLVIWSRVFWTSVTRNLRNAQRWSKSVFTFDRCRPYSITFGYHSFILIVLDALNFILLIDISNLADKFYTLWQFLHILQLWTDRFWVTVTANVNLYHVTNFSLYLSFTDHNNYTENSRFTPVLSITIVFSRFHRLIFYIENYLTLNLTFAVCC